MFGIAFMGILTSCAQGLVGLVGDIVAAITSCCGLITGSFLGFAQGLEFTAVLCGEGCMALLRALTCGIL